MYRHRVTTFKSATNVSDTRRIPDLNSKIRTGTNGQRKAGPAPWSGSENTRSYVRGLGSDLCTQLIPNLWFLSLAIFSPLLSCLFLLLITLFFIYFIINYIHLFLDIKIRPSHTSQTQWKYSVIKRLEQIKLVRKGFKK